MKFKYTGRSGVYCLELLAYKLMDKKAPLNKGQIIEVPDSNKVVINALDASGNFERVEVKKEVKKGDK